MTIWYLDNDDEITDAVARLRGTDAEQVIFVVPPGSRIATGRINFKLLAREAAARDLAMAIASPDEQVRALATSAGVIAAATPDQAEAALERGDEPVESAPATEMQPRTVSALAATSSGRGTFTWRSRRLRFVTVALLVFVVVAGFVVTETLPTAEITLVPRLTTVGPLQVPVVASAETAEVDVAQGVIPAVAMEIQLEAEDAYAASGSETIETPASGAVTFSALDQEFDQEIAAGTRVLTPAGIAFQTTQDVTLPRSDGAASVEARVEALTVGEEGNVPAETISVVPSLESQGIAVSNPDPTSGGRFEATPLVTAADYDAAAVDLRNRLTGELAAYLRDPVDAPEGSTVYPGSAVLGPLTLEPTADEVVGRADAEFRLAGSAQARVLAVDESAVDEVARVRLLAAVPAGLAIVADTLEIGHGEGTADGAAVAFGGTASGRAVAVIDPDALLDQIAGLPVSDAQAILEGLGSATVNVWPGFVGDLPNDRQRITLDVSEASDTE